jgi:hypothetical protein
MKRSIVALTLACGFMALNTHSQTSGSASGAAGAGSAGAAAQGSANGTIAPAPNAGTVNNQTVQNQTQNQNQNQAGVANPNNRFASATNQNQFGTITNESGLQTSPLVNGATNGLNPGGLQVGNPLTGIVQGGTNGLGISGMTNGSLAADQAFSAPDKALNARIRQTIQPQIAGLGQPTPVHMVVRDGVVTLVGFVPTEDAKRRIQISVQRTPGVVRVVDGLRVQAGANANGSYASGFNSSTNLSPTTGLPVTPTSNRSNLLNRVYATNNPALAPATNTPPTDSTTP